MRREAAVFLSEMAQSGSPRWLCLFGTCGAGKTFLADLILTAVKRYRLTKSSVSTPNGDGCGMHFRAEYRIRWEIALDRALKEREWDWVDDVCRSKFAEIDDIATGLVPANISTPKLAMLAERRLGKWTVWTCNKSLQQIKDDLDARIASRMLRGGSVIVDVDVKDFNLR